MYISKAQLIDAIQRSTTSIEVLVPNGWPVRVSYIHPKEFVKVIELMEPEQPEDLNALRENAERYLWLKEQKNLELRSTEWIRADGSTYPSHHLAAGGKQYAPEDSLDKIVDNARGKVL